MLAILYHVSIFKNLGVAANGPLPLSEIAPRAPLLKILDITSGRGIQLLVGGGLEMHWIHSLVVQRC